jgi:hypothetical protein
VSNMNIRDALKTETATTLRLEAEAQAGIERDEAEWLWTCPICAKRKKDFVCGICCDCLGI